MDVTPYLNPVSNKPLYVQLYEHMKQEIEAGRMTSGSRLPSIRQLSRHLGISRTTIEAAYEQLVAEGYAESRPKSGIYVLELEDVPTVFQAVPDIRIEEKEEPPRYNFNYGDIELGQFPMKTWKKCLMKATEEEEVLLYGERQGDALLRGEIARYIFQARGVACQPEQVLICSGTQQAISFLCQLLSLQGRPVAMENPGYNGVRAVFSYHGCNVRPISLEVDGIHVEELAGSGAEVAYVTPSHQFPYGAVLSIQKRARLLQWAYETGGFIIEDDYDSEFRYQGQPVPSLKALDTNERVIYMGTFSKCFLPGARVSYIVLPPLLLRLYQESFDTYNQAASAIIQRALYMFMKEGHFERHVRKMKKLYQGKHRMLLQAIERHMGERAEVIGQRAGLHILLNVKETDNETVVKRAREQGVKVYTPEKYWVTPSDCPSSLLMIGFGGLSEAEIDEGIRLLADAAL